MPATQTRLASALADRYRVEREIGVGGMAVVYLAEDLKHGRHVAIKVLKPELAATLGSDRFLREIEIAARLSSRAAISRWLAPAPRPSWARSRSTHRDARVSRG